jgi:energy-coupling factor transporter transmembrane protein EcfT
MRIHPYALLIGAVIGVMILLALRHPPFAILMTLISIVGLDYFFKNRKPPNKNTDKDGSS